ncbi:MAG TPA: YraN family protein [Candidatus Saccharimonadia bacterium]
MSVESGKQAEALAADWLAGRGFQILDRNWRTRWCELDIIADQGGVIHIIEVKYRRRSDFGSGFEYITPNKAGRLQRGALMWLKAHRQSNSSFQIDVIAITGATKPENVTYLPNALGW